MSTTAAIKPSEGNTIFMVERKKHMLEALNVMNDRLKDLFASKDDFASIRGSRNFEARTKTRFEKSSQQGQYKGKS